jgi:predicted ATPase with chaperone activity
VLSADLEGTAAEGLGVRRSVVENLTLKTLFYLGDASIQELAEQLRIAPYIVEGVFQRLRKDQLIQATGLAAGGHRVNLTGQGRTRAMELLGVDQYVGPVPVSLADYVERVKSQSVRDISVNSTDVTEAFKELVLEDGMLAQLGTAVISGRAIFLYGPPGTGKTTVAEKLSDLFRKESIWVPYAIEVDGQIITVYDPHTHERIEGAGGLSGDMRWVRCRRPRLMVGGELTIDMLDLQYNPTTRFYTAPVQMRANNGFLIVDDFGRQRIPPADLLNRWVVPLDRRVDFLSMAGGKKLQIPFDLFVVFATNLDPATVVEEAFLRRIQTKINLGKVTTEQFHEIFKRACANAGVAYDAELVTDVMHRIEREFEQPLRACQPNDLINQILWRAKFTQSKPALSLESLHDACKAYFLVSRSEAESRTGGVQRGG